MQEKRQNMHTKISIFFKFYILFKFCSDQLSSLLSKLSLIINYQFHLNFHKNKYLPR